MRPVQKFFFFSLLFSLLSFLLVSVGQPDTSLNLKNKPHPSFNLQTNPMIDDFLVNDDTGTFDQELPAIVVDGSGNFVITWVDYRKGDLGGDIYAQRYNSTGIPLDLNFKVNDDTETALHRSPAIALDESCNFVITWYDYRNITRDIYAQRYNSSGIPLSSNFKVSDDAGTAEQWSPTIAMNRTGNFVIAWEDYRNNYSDIYAQRYNSSGTPLGSNFKVSDDAGTSYQWDPAIAMDSSGNFVITWRDERNGIYNFDVYAQRYNSSRTPLGSNFKVNDDAGTTWQWEPAITMHSSGNFVITWEDYRDGSADIYAQRYNSSGIPQGSNFKVSDDTETSDQYYPVITIDASGKFLIAWQDYRNGNPDIYAQRYNSSGNSDGSNYLVSNCHDTASTAQIYPAIASNTSNIYFTWMDDRRGNWDIYAKVVDWTWTKVEEDQEVSLPNSFDLAQNYPNPFNPTTTIQFRVGSLEFGEPIHTTLKIYNILGRLVRTLIDEEKLPGNYSVVWDGKDNSNKEVTSGIYLYQLKTIDYTNTRKMVLLR